MNTTRTGKIARLPKYYRHELSRRLENGESGAKIVAWLNAAEEVQEVLEEYFNGHPITEQNLSEWRQGGHQDWLRLEETRVLSSQLVEQVQSVAQSVNQTAGAQTLSDHFAAVVAVEFVRLAQTMLNEDADPKQRWASLCDIQKQLSHLRRDDHRASQLVCQNERYRRQFAAEDTAAEQAADAEERRQRLAPFKLRPIVDAQAAMRGGSDAAHDIAAYIVEVENNLEYGTLGRKNEELAPKKKRSTGPASATAHAATDSPAPSNTSDKPAASGPPLAPNRPLSNPIQPLNAKPTGSSAPTNSHKNPSIHPSTNPTPSPQIQPNPTFEFGRSYDPLPPVAKYVITK